LVNAKLLANRISEYSREVGITKFNISLHGGEPTLIGANNLREILQEIQENCTATVRFGMQSNGTLITDEMSDVLSKFSVRVAISLDGDTNHNRFRIDHHGKPTWSRAVEGLNKVKQAGLFSGIQVVIDQSSDPVEVLDALFALSPPEIELGQPFGTHDNPPVFQAGAMSLGDWLCRAFDHWTSSPLGAHTKVTILTDVLVSILTGKANSEWFSNKPAGYLIVSANGSYEGLDTLKVVGEDGRILGLNLASSKITDALEHKKIREREELSLARPTGCQKCPIIDWCNGGYYPTRHKKDTGFDNPSIYCADWKVLFNHVGDWVLENYPDHKEMMSLRHTLNTLKLEITDV